MQQINTETGQLTPKSQFTGFRRFNNYDFWVYFTVNYMAMEISI